MYIFLILRFSSQDINSLIRGKKVDQESFWNQIVTPRIGTDREVTKDSHPYRWAARSLALLLSESMN